MGSACQLRTLRPLLAISKMSEPKTVSEIVLGAATREQLEAELKKRDEEDREEAEGYQDEAMPGLQSPSH